MVAQAEPQSSKKPVSKKRTEAKDSGVDLVQVEVPVSCSEAPGFRLHVDISLEGDDATVLRRIACGLAEADEKVNGHACRNVNDAIRFLIRKLAESHG